MVVSNSDSIDKWKTLIRGRQGICVSQTTHSPTTLITFIINHSSCHKSPGQLIINNTVLNHSLQLPRKCQDLHENPWAMVASHFVMQGPRFPMQVFPSPPPHSKKLKSPFIAPSISWSSKERSSNLLGVLILQALRRCLATSHTMGRVCSASKPTFFALLSHLPLSVSFGSRHWAAATGISSLTPALWEMKRNLTLKFGSLCVS